MRLREPDRHRGDRALIDHLYDGDLFAAVQAAAALQGAYAIAVFPPRRAASGSWVRAQGRPLIVGVGQGRNFLASDAMALAGDPTRSSTSMKATWSTCSWAACGSTRSTATAAVTGKRP